MPLVLVSVLALAALAAALVLLKSRADLRTQLDRAQAENAGLTEARDTATAERDELRDKVEWLTASNGRLVEEGERQRERAEELALLLEAATSDTSGGDDESGLWNLLLAHITRRWAAVVGVPPDGRSVIGGTPAAQLLQALSRETERLREEVGVDVELNAPAGPDSHDAGDPTGHVAVLVAALELLGVLATSAQRVTVDVGDTLVITGDGWIDPYDELASVYERVTAAGVALDPLEVGEERVRLVVRHTVS